MTYLIISLGLLLIAPITAFIAGQRGYDVMSWYFVGLLLGPLGLLAGFLPKRAHEPEIRFS
ncbi:MAG: hypothetical protein IPH05_05785 [Flavobacteriales bacterium]|jgi:hypothetical protein|nr:hypothetical protein [Flavobacteriales bacterium]MBK6882445.1 hypothetical protein [Flavobacteriales bacterium]MBK7101341.1 hypothetical protein [Flavobacteriales bacterium]MBK7112049.1 hypothetical protein [Flavobacteriales bacterium]MBK7481954.1 hypothetical protein [Flavobacteriales bacterium]